MREEYGPDGANAMVSAAAHRQRLVDGFRKVRDEIDAFQPDFVLIWGDDQYENFHEDLVPPFSVYICDEYKTQPYHKRRYKGDGDEVFNVWGEDMDHVFTHAGHPEAAKFLATRLLEMGYPMPYAYKTLHFQGLPHAFLNTLLFLDYDRKGFDYPVIPFHVNCYGSAFVKNKGGSPLQADEDAEPDPPAPLGQTLLRRRGRDGPRLQGQQVPRRAHGLVELVARIPRTQAPHPLPRRGGRHRALRRAARRPGAQVGRALHGRHRGCRAARVPQLDLRGGRPARARLRAEDPRLHHNVYIQFIEMLHDGDGGRVPLK